MPDTTPYRKALLDRLGELDSRLHQIEAELDEPHSKDWEENAVEREGDEVLERLGHSGEAEIARMLAGETVTDAAREAARALLAG